MQGDLNARTGNERDFIEYDKFDISQHLPNSEDQIINTRGNELLDLCKLNDFLIVNGRKVIYLATLRHISRMVFRNTYCPLTPFLTKYRYFL